MDPIAEELNSILREVEGAITAKLYYLAIAVALSVPDICSCLEFDPDNPEWAERKTYVRWCESNLDFRFANLNGNDLYNIRGGVVHKGQFHHSKSRFNRVVFTGPESPIRAHDSIIRIPYGVRLDGKGAQEVGFAGDVLVLDVTDFCETIMSAARAWYRKKYEDPFVQRNLQKLVRHRPNGIPPFIVGAPVIG